MSLRWRLALALGLLGAAAVTAVAALAYVTTSRQLGDDTDAFLAERSRLVLATARVAPERFPDGTGRRRWPRDPLFRLDTVTQVLDADGKVLVDTGPAALPVDERDLALAARGDAGQARRRSVTVDGTPYRMQTTALDGGGALQLARDTSDSARVLDRLAARFVRLGLLVTALAALVGFLIARRITAPLARLTGAAEEVADTGELDHDLPAGGRDEVGRLAGAFRTMLDRLARSRASQHQLVQDASHELRTPLTSLRTNVEVLRRHEELDADARRPILADLDAETTALADLVDELVELATDRRDDEPEQTVDLGALVQRAAERAERRTGRPIVVDVAAPEVVAGRPAALGRAVANLLDNAAKFAPAGSPIEVRVADGRVEVRDHGPGIAPADQGRVFDRFYRAADARSAPGSGLGLAIVRAVAEDHGGRAWATNHPGGGAIVGFEVARRG